jgi:hypothetical protein
MMVPTVVLDQLDFFDVHALTQSSPRPDDGERELAAAAKTLWRLSDDASAADEHRAGLPRRALRSARCRGLGAQCAVDAALTRVQGRPAGLSGALIHAPSDSRYRTGRSPPRHDRVATKLMADYDR